MAERKVKAWITVNGVHVPLYEGESKDDAVKRSIKQAQENRTKDDDQKEKDIARNQSEKDKLNKANSHDEEIIRLSKELDKNGVATTNSKTIAEQYSKNNNPNKHFTVTKEGSAYKIESADNFRDATSGKAIDDERQVAAAKAAVDKAREKNQLNNKSKYEQAGLNESEVKEYLKNNPDARREANMLLKAGRDFDEASIWAYKAAMHDKNVTKTKSIKDLISDTKKLSDAREKGKDVKKAEKEIQDNFKAYFNNMSAGDYFVVKYDLGPDDDKYREVYIKKSTGDDGFYFKSQRDGRRNKEIDNSLKGTSGGSSDGSAAESIVRNISWSHRNKGNFDITFGNANSETLEELKRRKFN